MEAGAIRQTMDVSDKAFYITAAVTGVLCAILAVVYIKVRGHEKKWTIMSFGAAVVFGLATVAQLAVAIAPLPLANRGGQGNPQPPHGTIDSPSGPSQSPPVSAVYWQGAVGITFGPPGGINFDLKPPTTSADSPTNISFGGNILENSWTGTPVLISQWTGAGRPKHDQCANWVLTHPTRVVNNVAEGMQICIRTVQGRIGQLTVTSISPDQSTLNVMAVIWN